MSAWSVGGFADNAVSTTIPNANTSLDVSDAKPTATPGWSGGVYGTERNSANVSPGCNQNFSFEMPKSASRP